MLQTVQKGLALLLLKAKHAAQQAVQEMNGKEIDGRTVKVSIAKPPKEREGGGGGGMGGGMGGGRSGGGRPGGGGLVLVVTAATVIAMIAAVATAVDAAVIN